MASKGARRLRHGEASRQLILEETEKIASERGYAGTTIGLVSRRTGLPPSSVYWHFGGKDELLAETVTYSHERWLATAEPWEPPHGTRPLTDQVVARLTRAVAVVALKPEFWRLGNLLVLERRIEQPPARQRYLEVRLATVARLAEWWSSVCASVGVEDPDLPRRLAGLHFAAMDGLSVAARAGRQRWDAERLIAIVARGLVAQVIAAAHAEGEDLPVSPGKTDGGRA